MSTEVRARAPAGAGAIYSPNDALRLETGGLAVAVARVLARPHRAYFDADPGKRRLIVYLAARGVLAPSDGPILSEWSMRRLMERFDADAPSGFGEALKRGVGPWSRDAFQKLRALLIEGGDGAKALRHLPTIDEGVIAKITELPAGLRAMKIIALTPDGYMAGLIARAVRRAHGRTPEPMALRGLAQRLERAGGQETMFAWLIEALGVYRLTPAPIPGTDWLRPIQDVRDIERTALKFRNCLRTRTPMMLLGKGAYFEVLGDEPAVVEVLANRKGGWSIGEIRGHANDAVSAALMGRITAYLGQFQAKTHGQVDQLVLELAMAAGW